MHPKDLSMNPGSTPTGSFSMYGKTSIMNRYLYGYFNDYLTPTDNYDFGIKKIITNNREEIKLKIFDTDGRARYDCLNINHIKNADSIILIYDITNYESFLIMMNWLDTIN